MSDTLDDRSRILLRELQRNARLTNAELAEQVDLSPSGVQKRLRRLEEKGVIRQYATIVDRQALGYSMLCFVHVTLRWHEAHAIADFDATVRALPEVLECHRVTGDFDYLLKVAVRDRQHLDRFLIEQVATLKGLDRVKTSVVLAEIKETTVLDIPPTPVAEAHLNGG